MNHRSRFSAHLVCFLAVATLDLSVLCAPAVIEDQHPLPRRVRLRYVYSPFADYLFYLLYRNTNEFTAVTESVPLDGIPAIDKLVSLPEAAASASTRDYKKLFALLEPYRRPAGRVVMRPQPRILAYEEPLPAYDALRSVIAKGESSYPRFLAFWQTEVAPVERRTIETWQQQQASHKPLERLQALARLPFPFTTLDVGCIAFHFAGSANYSPPGIYSRVLSKPNLPWLIGHEATHLLVDKHVGHNWTRHPLAAQAIRLVQEAGGTESDIEESLCLFMQLTLSQECGYSDKSLRMSDRLGESAPIKKRICRALEQRWSDYLTDPQEYPTLIDYLLHRSIAAFRVGPAP